MATPTISRPQVEPPARRRIWPSTSLGKWALGLLVVIAAFPFYWPPLGRALEDPPAIIIVPLAIALPGFVTSAVAIFRRHDESIALRTLFWICVAEVTLTALLFLAMGLGNG